MRSFVLQLICLLGMLLGLPLLGVVLGGLPIERYLEFPPRTRYIVHAPFAREAFILLAAVIAAVVLALAATLVRAPVPPEAHGRARRRLPWWGWLGLVTGMASWVLAWSRFGWFGALQRHTFLPLWLSYILVINALCHRRSGRCMLTHRPGYLLILFPASALFWWFFEYLNRFVQNWYYAGASYPPLEYFLLASLSFATVLPAVLGTREYLLSFARIQAAFAHHRPLNVGRPKILAAAALGCAGAGLAGIGVWPDVLFPLLWLAPLIILVGVQGLAGQPHVLTPLSRGDWRLPAASALAALLCGGFWEMWNFYSLAKWHYAIPLVHRLEIFEMPLLGYAGYLPFGLECTAVGMLIERLPRLRLSR